MLIGAQEILCLIQDRLGYLFDILGVGMLALCLPTKALLTEADALCTVVNEVLLNGFFATCGDTGITEVILAVFCEEMFTGNFFDGGVEIRAVIQFFDS
jgi:hypothetical protein